ncbi:MAG: glycoside hydrolase family 3 N-terminal domain-containing protein [Gemmatimonadaceae bacterium]|nr:glycoside hydrolase family 3 N-terminal domain-containing protein [Gemmatimonadaceae bacterium]
MTSSTAAPAAARIDALLEAMTLEEKIGQLQQVQAGGWHVPDHLRWSIREGRIGAVLNEVHVDTVNELQRIAVEESRHGIPLLVGRDVIHGFKTVLPIPLGQAATWNPDLVTRGARIAALEARAAGINWTFAPMLDISRDPRWGRVAEGLGEDPFLCSTLGAAMVRGFQTDDLSSPEAVAACAKHFVGYGASESGRDYNTTNIPENELRNVYLTPFHAAVQAGVASVMTSFSDIDGVPASANEFLLRQILRGEWGFGGVVVSDWESIRQLQIHGLTASDRDSAREAATAGVDIEMASTTYADHLAALVHSGEVPEATVDALVRNVLHLKERLGLFDSPYVEPHRFPAAGCAEHLEVAREAAAQSLVLLRNDDRLLPLSETTHRRIALIGPLADDVHEQLGTWIFDGDATLSRTIAQGLRDLLGDGADLRVVHGVPNTRSHHTSGIAEAVEAARAADVAVLVLGEEAILSGEAHCRADIGLPGAQEALLRAVEATGTPVVLVLLAGRPLALERELQGVRTVLWGFHPGTMTGPAVADVLFGRIAPSGKLPMTFPRVTGQVPMYYNEKPSGKPATPETIIHLHEIAPRAPQLSVGNTSFHLDVHPSPLFPFGHGLSYTTFEYRHITTSQTVVRLGESIEISADVTNTGDRPGTDVVQLYIRDLAGSVTRPVRELKGFERVTLAPGETRTVRFTLPSDALAFYGRRMTRVVEPGHFHAWIGGSSAADLRTDFVLSD